jgi:hypothetical protein
MNTLIRLKPVLLIFATAFCLSSVAQLSVDAGDSLIVCSGDNAGEYSIGGAPSATGGVEPYTYSWSGKHFDLKYPSGKPMWIFALDIMDDTTKSNPVIKDWRNVSEEWTTYYLKVEDAVGNVQVDSVKIIKSAFWVHPIYKLPKTIYRGDSVRFFGDIYFINDFLPLKYSLSPSYGLTDTTDIYGWAKPDTSVTYCLQAINSLGCVSEKIPYWEIEVIDTIKNVAQSFIDEIKQWNIVSRLFETTNYYTSIYQFSGDSALNGKTYHKLYESTDSIQANWRLNSLWRENNESVYTYNDLSSADDLIYDFNINVGDTFEVIDFLRMKVDSVGFKNWGETVRKCWYFSKLGGYSPISTVWIDGIGQMGYFIRPTEMDITGAFVELLCFHEKGNLVYQNPQYNDCYINTSISAQNISITDSLNRWNIGLNCVRYEPIDPYNRWSTYFVHIEGDTVMNNKHYKKLFHCADSTCINKDFKSYIREDSGKVFLANKTRELILYDFNLNKGDSLVMYFLRDDMDSNPLFIQIDSVKTGIFQDQKERLMQFVSVSDNYNLESSFEDVLVEGIGSLRFGLEYPGNLFFTGANGCYANLLCFYTDKNLVYSNPEFNDCHITTGINQLQVKPVFVNVFSAQNGILVVELTSSVPGTIFVFNTLGDLVSQEKILDSTSQFCMQGSGVYLYRFVSNDGRVQTGKVFIR